MYNKHYLKITCRIKKLNNPLCATVHFKKKTPAKTKSPTTTTGYRSVYNWKTPELFKRSTIAPGPQCCFYSKNTCKTKQEIELTWRERGRRRLNKKWGGGGKIITAAKQKNKRKIPVPQDCTNENFFYLPRRFKRLAKPPWAACKTCHLDTSAEVLNCFYTECDKLVRPVRQYISSLFKSECALMLNPYSSTLWLTTYSIWFRSLLCFFVCHNMLQRYQGNRTTPIDIHQQ